MTGDEVIGNGADAGICSTVPVVVGSLQPPNQPRLLHDVLLLEVGVVVTVREGAGVAEDVVDVSVVVVGSLHPNHPGVLQVDVEVLVVVVDVVDVVVVVSRQPHQPGVSQVVVRVFVDVVELDFVVVF